MIGDVMLQPGAHTNTLMQAQVLLAVFLFTSSIVGLVPESLEKRENLVPLLTD